MILCLGSLANEESQQLLAIQAYFTQHVFIFVDVVHIHIHFNMISKLNLFTFPIHVPSLILNGHSSSKYKSAAGMMHLCRPKPKNKHFNTSGSIVLNVFFFFS